MAKQEDRPVTERRSNPRVQVPYRGWVADVRCQNRVQKAITVDVSQNGMGLYLERDLPVGSPVELCIALPGQRTGYGRGSVVRIADDGARHVGLALVNKSPTLARAIDDCLPRPS